MAEFIFCDMLKKHNKTDVTVTSRAARTDEIGSDTYYHAKKTLDAHSIPYSSRHAQLITQAEFDDSDIIIVMDDENVRDMQRKFGQSDKVKKLMSYCGLNRDVSDPWYTRDFEQAFNDIYAGCENLIKQI